ncbi:hypothetical protein ACLQ22_09455 [Micromonospora sp. DT178]
MGRRFVNGLVRAEALRLPGLRALRRPVGVEVWAAMPAVGIKGRLRQ